SLASQLFQRLQYRQMGLTRTELLYAAALGQPHITTANVSGDKPVDQRGLADAGLAGDEHRLPVAASCAGQSRSESIEIALSADQAWAISRRCAIAALLQSELERCDESKPQAMHGGDVAWLAGAVAQRQPHLVHCAGQRGIADDHSRPHLLE